MRELMGLLSHISAGIHARELISDIRRERSTYGGNNILLSITLLDRSTSFNNAKSVSTVDHSIS
jgi:hypothetical protein